MKKKFCSRKKQETAAEPKGVCQVKKIAAVITFCVAAVLLGYGRKRQKSLAAAQENTN